MEEPVIKELLMDSLKMTYEKAVHDNTEDFMCLSEMIVTLVSLLKAKEILTDGEAQIVCDIPNKRLGEKK